MAINIEIEKSPNENSNNIVRRFTKKVQGSGIMQRARSLRFFERARSSYVKKRRALKTISKRAEFQKMLKLGTAPQTTKKRR